MTAATHAEAPLESRAKIDATLGVLSDLVDDLENVRMATANRVEALTRPLEEHGMGYHPDHEIVALLTSLRDTLITLEADAVKRLEAQIKASPYREWIDSQRGIGYKQAARLLATIGDPYWHTLENRPRTVSELWAYCGYSVIDGQAQRRRSGVKSNWNSRAKSKAWLIAKSILMSRGPIRELYDAEKALAGTTLPDGRTYTDGHAHSRGLRRMAKEVLRQMWEVARDVHAAEARAA